MSDEPTLDVASARFIRALKREFPHQAAEIENNLRAILGDYWSENLVFDLLSDNHRVRDRVVLNSVPAGQLIPTIRSIRMATGMGLKPAKDIVDATNRGVPQEIDLTDVSEENRELFVKELANIGCGIQET